MTLHLALLTSLISRNAGGLFNSVRRLGQSLDANCGVQTSVLGVEDECSASDLGAWMPLVPQVYPRVGPRAFQFAPRLFAGLMAANSDLVHVHGIWTYPSVACSRWSRKAGRPYLISPRGMLDSWALQNSAWKKTIASLLFEGRHLRHAKCLHALCQSEAQSIRKYGLKNPICTIANGVDLPDDLAIGRSSARGEKKSLVFLGRIHPKKGLERGLEGWTHVKRAKRSGSWQFLIAGWDQGGHTAHLERHCDELGLTHRRVEVSEWLNRSSSEYTRPTNGGDCAVGTVGLPDADVVFLGPAFGSDKDQLLRTANAFILPSFSEGLPMALLEAWAYGLPALMTPECNLPEGFAAGAALRITHPLKGESKESTDSIGDGLATLFEMNDSDRIEMGNRGRRLVEQSFTWPRIASQMKAVYDWIVGGGVPPATITC